MQKISDRLKEAMKLRNLKPVDLVNRTKISKGAISSYIAGNYTPKSKNIYSLAKALNVSPVWLLGYDVPMDDEINSNNEKNDLIDFLLSTNYEDIESIVKKDKEKKIIKYFSTPDIIIDIYSNEMNNELINICNHYENIKKLKNEIVSDIIDKTLTLAQNSLLLSEETKDAFRMEYQKELPEILDFADSFLTDEDNLIIYDYQVNGKILSLLLKMFDYRSEYDYPVVSFHTYNFDLDEGFLLTDQEVLDLFSTTTEDVSKTIEEKFHEFYDDEVALGYLVPQQCDYQCFLNWRGVDNYMDNVYYYVKNGKLVVYKAFTIYSVFGEEEYFTDSSYEFNIK